ncbi:hypothetical protein [Asticcacaulis benevestitus]|uniref:Uncharacterized protein n=1 Tax=Asticcacaulis benevestitus DSM 16100 = ATCC BAA-896 TaxID=1121022 RepID=V4PCH2_9CAUL|nr:hypothetical protein [Asticcacaulis benevestitus]ESQ83000.1 hypothetical protein ABENE_20545 [Asticcacaulis benevestitus DSM 16100 = ATCC BAA-896]
MNSTTTIEYTGIMSRTATGLKEMRAKIEPLGKAYLAASVSLVGISAAFAIEMFTMTVALNAKYQALSDGTDLGNDLMHLRYGIGVALFLGHTLLHDNPVQAEHPLFRVLQKARVVPVLAIIGGMAVFMFTATAQATGSDDGQLGLGGIALGVVCSALFSVSFLACNKLMGMLIPAAHTILAGWAQRAEVAKIERDVKAVDEYRAQLKALQRSIDERQEPDALEWMAAEAAAAEVGKIAAEAHDEHASVDAVKDVEFRQQDVRDLPDTPLEALDKRQTYLKSLNVAYFFNLLKNKKGA